MTSYGKTKQDTPDTDRTRIYGNLMIQEQAVQLINETDSEEEFEDFQ